MSGLLTSKAADDVLTTVSLAFKSVRPTRKPRLPTTTDILGNATVAMTTASPPSSEVESRCCRAGRKWSRFHRNCTLATSGRRREWYQLIAMTLSARDRRLLSGNLVQHLERCAAVENERDETQKCCLERLRHRQSREGTNRRAKSGKGSERCDDVMNTRSRASRRRCNANRNEHELELATMTTTVA